MDISNFMSWFLNQVISIFTFCFNTLNSITFMGTSLLKVILTITILVPLLSVILTIGKSTSVVCERVNRYEREKNRSDSK